jgi:hypothetical protein
MLRGRIPEPLDPSPRRALVALGAALGAVGRATVAPAIL